MTDILPHIAALLAPLGAQIEQSYPDTSVSFPVIVLHTISDVGLATDCVEYFTRMTVQLDAYTLDKDETYDLAQKINAIMTGGGFKRSNAFPLTEGELERYQMTYTCNIDYTHNRIITT